MLGLLAGKKKKGLDSLFPTFIPVRVEHATKVLAPASNVVRNQPLLMWWSTYDINQE